MASLKNFFLLLLLAFAARADVVISEFMADNETTLLTRAGTPADWVELHNDGTEPVDLSDWGLSDNVKKPFKWKFPAGTTIDAGAYQVVFADSSDVSLVDGELHTSWSLSKDGEYLGLTKPDGTVVSCYAPTFPIQFGDVSYGLVRDIVPLIDNATPYTFRVTGSVNVHSATGGLGFASDSGLFTCRQWDMNTAIANLDAAEAYILDGTKWKTDRTYPIANTYETVCFADKATQTYFPTVPFPGNTSVSVGKDNFVVLCEGNIFVPSAGEWTFAVGSDDGFRLSLTGPGGTFTSEFPSPRSFAQTLSTFNIPAAGAYAVRLLFYEKSGNADCTFSVAKGSPDAFSPETFKLVGDPAGGVVLCGALKPHITTDVGALVKNTAAGVLATWRPVLRATATADDRAILSIRAADGFRVMLNGTVIAVTNFPSPYTSSLQTATAARTPAEALQWIDIPITVAVDGTTAGRLAPGTNTLVITALNNTFTDADLFLQARLDYSPSGLYPRYSRTPTPGAANHDGGLTESTPEVVVSEPRGYKTQPFSVTLSCPSRPDAVIYYTTDGSTPTIAKGRRYTGPIKISATSVLRASVPDSASILETVTAATWLFLDDIFRQSETPPTGWPANAEINAQAIKYGMRTDIVDGDRVRLAAGMTNAIATISLSTDLGNLFNAQTGIYVNAANDGRGWERPVSVEQIDPVHGTANEFHINAGLRIRGAASRGATHPKHSFRLFFRSEYGAGKLSFPLFGEEGAKEFDKVDLRTSQNYSWAGENSAAETFVRETFSRDSQRDMGRPYTRSRYYHLFINGIYWGLYQTQERGGADFAATYLEGKPDELDGEPDDWDCIKTSKENSGYVTTAADGTFDTFYALCDIAAEEGFAGAAATNYWRIQGLNQDGSVNTGSPVLLDTDNLIDYMLITHYTGDSDSPVGLSGKMANNMYAIINRVTPTGFVWLRHDAEHSLGAHGSYPVTCNLLRHGVDLLSRETFNPSSLNWQLLQNPEYRMRFADAVQRHFYGNGALTPENARARFKSRMDEIDLAIIAESARWGNGKTRDKEWMNACNAVLNTYLVQRRDILVRQYREIGWYPSVSVPEITTNAAASSSVRKVRLSAPDGFYYTTDGSDPRLAGGMVNPSAVGVAAPLRTDAVLFPSNAVWSYFDAGTEPPAAGQVGWKDAAYDDSGWSVGAGIFGFAGSAPLNPVTTVTRRYVGETTAQVSTTYFRKKVMLGADASRLVNLHTEVLFDDGFILYINGVEVDRMNMDGRNSGYDVYSSATTVATQTNRYLRTLVFPVGTLHEGENTFAVEVHQCHGTSSDLYFDMAASYDASCYEILPAVAEISARGALTVKARSLREGEWSALAEITLDASGPPLDYSVLRVTELMYAPLLPTGSTFDDSDLAWIELRNFGTNNLPLEGVAVTGGIDHVFGPVSLAAGNRLVLVKNPDAFASVYPTNDLNLVAWDDGKLAKKGELLSFVDPDGKNILTFTYSKDWYPETYGTGLTLVSVDPFAAEALWSTAENWRVGGKGQGTPGQPDAPAFSGLSVSPNGARPVVTFDVKALDGTPEIWVSDDLVHWSRCPESAWSLDGTVFRLDTGHSDMPSGLSPNNRFFQLRVK